ncbi:hypothetical protein HQQ80_20455 [Microbacteriaceae bacterium VKM Ac-2855]|nr:hypothetical protein [Microbacteriaceae bacterium VKM Ac-2855]
MAAAAPHAAASPTDVTLAFDRSSYAVPACGSAPAIVTATANGVPAAGVPVTVLLPAGITSGGQSTITGVTDAQGRLSVPLDAGVTGVNAQVTAMAGSATTAAGVSVNPNATGAELRTRSGSTDTLTATVPGATVVKAESNGTFTNRYVLDSSKNLRDFNNGAIVATNVVDFAPSPDVNGVRYITTTGELRTRAGSTDTLITTVPGARVIKTESNNTFTNRYVLDSSGNLHDFNNGVIVATNVVDFAPSPDVNGVRYITTTGELRTRAGSTDTLTATVPGATVVKTESNGTRTNRFVLDSSGNLHDFNDGVIVATNVVDFAPSPDVNGVRYITTTGELRTRAGSTDTLVATVPGARVIETESNNTFTNRFVLDSSGILHDFNDGSIVATNVVDFAPSPDANGVRYIKSATSCS